jgi:PEP-CTERM motif
MQERDTLPLAPILGNDATDVELMSVNDFSSTFTFPSSGPVFNLPAGYTVSSVSADIVNNQYFGGAVVSTPEPGTIILLGTGVLSLAGILRRKRVVPKETLERAPASVRIFHGSLLR